MAYAGFDKAKQIISFAYPLQSTSGTATTPGLSFIQSTGTGFYLPASNLLGISVSGADIMRVTSDGKVGIGKIPTATLDVSATGSSSALSVTQLGTGPLLACSSNNTSVGLFVNNNGYTGVNTQSPNYQLHINSIVTSPPVPNFMGFPPITIIEETANAGANSQSTSSANTSWNKRSLNTIRINTIGVTLNNNLFTLPVGTYLIQADAIATRCLKHRIGLSNVQAGAITVLGTSEYVPSSAYDVSTKSAIVTIQVCQNQTEYGLYHWINSVATANLGLATPTAVLAANAEEVYARIIITRYQ